MERRALLSLLGAGTAALAGCTDRLPGDGADPAASPGSLADEQSPASPADSPSSSPTDAPGERRASMGEQVIVDKEALRVANPRVRPAVMRDFGAWRSLQVPAGQYLVVDVTAQGPVPDRVDEFDLRAAVDGEPTEGGPILLADDGAGGPFDPGEWERRAVGLPVPVAEHDAVAVHWGVDGTTVRWPVDDAVRTRLTRAPRFEVRELEATRLPGDEGVELDLTVANTGDRDGRFLAQVSFDAIEDASSAVSVEVPAGGTAGYEGVPRLLGYEGVEEVEVRFPAAGGSEQVTLSVPAQRETATARRSGETASDDRETATVEQEATTDHGGTPTRTPRATRTGSAE